MPGLLISSAFGNPTLDATGTTVSIIFGYYGTKQTNAQDVIRVYNNSTDRTTLFNISSAGTTSGFNSATFNTPLNVTSLTATGVITGTTANFVLNNAGGAQSIIRNPNAGSTSFTQFAISNDTANSLSIFLNSSTRTLDGGASGATIRNDAGSIRLQNGGSASTLTLSGSSATFNSDLTVTGNIYFPLLLIAQASGNPTIDATAGAIIFGYYTVKQTNALDLIQVYDNVSNRNLLFRVTTGGTSSGFNSATFNTPVYGTSLKLSSNSGGLTVGSIGVPNTGTDMIIQNDTTQFLQLCISGGGGQYSYSSNLGDAIIRSAPSRQLLLNSGSGAAGIAISGTTVNIPGTFQIQGITQQVSPNSGSYYTASSQGLPDQSWTNRQNWSGQQRGGNYDITYSSGSFTNNTGTTIICTCCWNDNKQSNAIGSFQLRIVKNNAIILARQDGAALGVLAVSATAILQNGDYLLLQGYQNSGSGNNFDNFGSVTFALQKI